MNRSQSSDKNKGYQLDRISRGNKIIRGKGISRADRITRGIMMILGAIFIAASIPKILHPGEFAEIVFNYQVMPQNWITLFAIVLPWVECVTGILLVFRVWAPGAVIIVNLLLLTFITVLAYDLTRGLNVRCGCFSTDITVAGPANIFYLFRDVIFSLMGLFLFFQVVVKTKRKSNK